MGCGIHKDSTVVLIHVLVTVVNVDLIFMLLKILSLTILNMHVVFCNFRSSFQLQQCACLGLDEALPMLVISVVII